MTSTTPQTMTRLDAEWLRLSYKIRQVLTNEARARILATYAALERVTAERDALQVAVRNLGTTNARIDAELAALKADKARDEQWCLAVMDGNSVYNALSFDKRKYLTAGDVSDVLDATAKVALAAMKADRG